MKRWKEPLGAPTILERTLHDVEPRTAGCSSFYAVLQSRQGMAFDQAGTTRRQVREPYDRDINCF